MRGYDAHEDTLTATEGERERGGWSAPDETSPFAFVSICTITGLAGTKNRAHVMCARVGHRCRPSSRLQCVHFRDARLWKTFIGFGLGAAPAAAQIR